MKKTIILCLIFVFFLSGCTEEDSTNKNNTHIENISESIHINAAGEKLFNNSSEMQVFLKSTALKIYEEISKNDHIMNFFDGESQYILKRNEGKLLLIIYEFDYENKKFKRSEEKLDIDSKLHDIFSYNVSKYNNEICIELNGAFEEKEIFIIDTKFAVKKYLYVNLENAPEHYLPSSFSYSFKNNNFIGIYDFENINKVTVFDENFNNIDNIFEKKVTDNIHITNYCNAAFSDKNYFIGQICKNEEDSIDTFGFVENNKYIYNENEGDILISDKSVMLLDMCSKQISEFKNREPLRMITIINNENIKKINLAGKYEEFYYFDKLLNLIYTIEESEKNIVHFRVYNLETGTVIREFDSQTEIFTVNMNSDLIDYNGTFFLLDLVFDDEGNPTDTYLKEVNIPIGE